MAKEVRIDGKILSMYAALAVPRNENVKEYKYTQQYRVALTPKSGRRSSHRMRSILPIVGVTSKVITKRVIGRAVQGRD